MAFVEKRDDAPGRMARDTERGTRETIKFAANDVAEGMARKGVEREQANVDQHDERAEADAEFAFERKGFENVVPKKTEKEDGEIKEIAMNILKNERKASFAFIVLAKARFTDRASRRIEEEGTVVGFAVVVASGTEAERSAKNQQRR